MRKFFISYVFEDRSYTSQLQTWASSGALGLWQAVAEAEDLRHGGSNKVRSYLSPLIQGCETLVLLVGNDTHNHPWIGYEVQNARSAGKRIIAMRIPGTQGGAPVGLGDALIRFSPETLRDALAR